MTQGDFKLKEVLTFLNSIEGHGYGGMAAFEIARVALQLVLEEPSKIEEKAKDLYERDYEPWKWETAGKSIKERYIKTVEFVLHGAPKENDLKPFSTNELFSAGYDTGYELGKKSSGCVTLYDVEVWAEGIVSRQWNHEGKKEKSSSLEVHVANIISCQCKMYRDVLYTNKINPVIMGLDGIKK